MTINNLLNNSKILKRQTSDNENNSEYYRNDFYNNFLFAESINNDMS